MSQKYDISSVYSFLLHTPEQGLRKILVDSKTFTETHLNLMLKIVRSCDEAKFTEHFEKQDFPKLKFGPAELKIRETFWPVSINLLNSRGLLSPLGVQKAA